MADTAFRPLTDRVVRTTVVEVDRATLGRFADELRAQTPGCYRLVADLRDVTFIDAGGVRALLAAAQAMREAGGELAVRNPGGAVRRVLDILDLDHLLAPS
jgi:stage II sporulation protein AA (anti-sigma F factor antagonist)